MSESNSVKYYRTREEQERSRAAACVDPGIAAIHIEMADRYSELVGKADPEPRPRLKLRVA